MTTRDLKNIKTHFAFGKNWSSYSELIDESRLEQARNGLISLVPAAEFSNRSFLDIGCGSGLHATAAARLGAGPILATDIDPESVATARNVLSKFAPSSSWRVAAISVFELSPRQQGQFDIVYSWGVLHHTGNMWEAIRKAAAMVAPGGLLAIALYRRTYLDPVWRIEKRIYAHSPRLISAALRSIFIAAFRTAFFIMGRNFQNYVVGYKSARGMDYYHDIHDWLGGYPYEAALAPEVEATLALLGFAPERVHARAKQIGLGGSACDEYVYRRVR